MFSAAKSSRLYTATAKYHVDLLQQLLRKCEALNKYVALIGHQDVGTKQHL